ncbi:phage tail protein [Pedobacter hiemivivus]|uniref:Phage tail protein n=1 Tax=Pedobacter hiemivivus TaxID=2530454 RepID=A0A4U1GMX7_9SPHI|nr:tail fiber protein [Pedobacter hiemivivus]TKC65688.1 phage tail protein [Pedobacter hiemivivus]
MDGYIGEIRIFSGNFAPKDWLFCDGATLDANYYRGLFAVIKTFYGGTAPKFNIPDLRGRAPVGMVRGSKYIVGASGGSATYQIVGVPPHTHQMYAAGQATDANTGNGTLSGTFGSRESIYGTVPEAYTLNDETVTLTGRDSLGPALNNEQPYIAVNYIICVNGIFPY